MSDDVQVIVDGTRNEPAHPKNTGGVPWLPIVLAFGLGLGLGVAVVAPSPVDEPPEEPSVLAPPVVEVSPLITDSGLGEVVAGFTDSIIAIADAGLGRNSLLFWPADGALRVTESGAGSHPIMDRSGGLIASSQVVPGLEGVILSIGRVRSLQPVAFGVTSYAWHDSKSGHLSYSVEANGEWQLWRTFTDLQLEFVNAPLLEHAWIAAWGDWGWAIQTGDGQVVMLTPTGEIRTTRPGAAVASDGEGWIVVINDRLEMVSAGGGVNAIEADIAGAGDVLTAELSPDGSKLALAGTEAVLVVPVDGDGAIMEFETPTSHSLAWTSDSRFVVVPGSRGIAILDVSRGVRQTFLSQYSIVQVGTTPSPGS